MNKLHVATCITLHFAYQSTIFLSNADAQNYAYRIDSMFPRADCFIRAFRISMVEYVTAVLEYFNHIEIFECKMLQFCVHYEMAQCLTCRHNSSVSLFIWHW